MRQILLLAVSALSFSSAHAYRGVELTYTAGGAIKNSSGTTIGTYCTGGPTAGKYSSASYSGASGCTNSTPGTDSDGDSMLDTWETTYSLNKYSATDRYADGDSDNCTNACEHARSGAPNDDDSDNDGIKDMDDSDFTGIGATANGTYKGRKVTASDLAE